MVLKIYECMVPYEIVLVDLKNGEQKYPEYLATKHPYGMVPVLEEEDGFTVIETHAIARYVAAKYGDGRLLPNGLREAAQFEQAVCIETAYFTPYVSGIARAVLLRKFHDLEPDEELAATLTEGLEESMKVYDVILAKQRFIAGDEFTLADIFHLGYGWAVTERLGVQALKSPETPNVARWWAEITSRDSWKAVVAERKASLE